MRSGFPRLARIATVAALALVLAVFLTACRSSEKAKTQADPHEGHNHAPGEGHGSGTQAAAIDWCPEHRVPESECTRCHPELAAKWKTQPGQWCNEHGVPEAHCYLCHPDIKFPQEEQYLEQQKKLGVKPAAAGADWCPEHRVPESECTRCHPELAAKWKSQPGQWCREHDVPEAHCYLCHPEIRFPQDPGTGAHLEEPSAPRMLLNTSLHRSNSLNCATDQKIIQLSNDRTVDRIGLQIEPARESAAAPEIEAVGEVEFDATTTYAVTSLVPGTLVKWVVNAGDDVSRGQTLAYLESLEGASIKSDYAQSLAALELSRTRFERQKTLFESGLVSQKEYQDAQAEFMQAQAGHLKSGNALKALGYSESETQDMLASDGGAWLPIRARNSGVLAEQRVALGEVLTEGTSVGLIAERGKLWVEARVRERDLARIAVGQRVTLSTDGDGLGRTAGVVTWVAESVDPLSRMGRVRIQPQLNGEPLYAHQFVNVRIAAEENASEVLVPRDAVQWEGCCNIVFVSETADRFRPRKVQVKFSDGGFYAVSGIRTGEQIVTKGSYLLKTELMKEGLGAGCCGTGA